LRACAVSIGENLLNASRAAFWTLMELFSSGATIVNVHSGQKDQRAVIDFYGTFVLPKVHAQLREA
jgi:hypothetical protein